MIKYRFEAETDDCLADSLIAMAYSKMDRQKHEEQIIWCVIGALTIVMLLAMLVCYN